MQPFFDEKPAATTQLNLFQQKKRNIEQSAFRTSPQLSRLKLWIIQRRGVGPFKSCLMLPTIELGTFCVLGRRDNRSTTAPVLGLQNIGRQKIWVARKGNSSKIGLESCNNHPGNHESQTAWDSVVQKHKLEARFDLFSMTASSYYSVESVPTEKLQHRTKHISNNTTAFQT